MESLYLCDGKACENCSPECRHTKDICHAVSFEKCAGGGYLEKDKKPLLVMKTDRLLKGVVSGAIDGAKKLLGIKSPYKEVIDRIRNDLKQQIEEGLVVVDGSITEIKFKHDSDGQLLVCRAELVEEVKNGES